MVEKEVIDTAMEMTKDIPATDNVLVPLQLPEDDNLTPYPEIEYMVVEATVMDKLVRDVNTQLKNGWQTEWGIQVVSGWTTNRYYQAMVRWNVDSGTKPEMPSENSEAGAMGPNAPLWEAFNFLENEPDLYEDVKE